MTKEKVLNLRRLIVVTVGRKKVYGGGQKNNKWFDFYYTIGDKQRAYLYIPDNWFFRYFDSVLNDWPSCKVLDDKSLYDLYFAGINKPHTIGYCCDGLWMTEGYKVSTMENVAEVCRNCGTVIIKPSVGSSGGHGISFWKEGEKDIEVILSDYRNCVVQEIIEQHQDLAAIHSESINTIRIMSMVLNGEVHLLSSILRMGTGNSKVDNVSSGGVACGIDENGCLRETTWNAKGQHWKGHPQGVELLGRKVPAFEQCNDLVKEIAPRFARFAKLVSWDFAVDKNENPLLIEANLYGGELDFHQMCNGPIFGDENTTRAMIELFYKNNSK